MLTLTLTEALQLLIAGAVGGMLRSLHFRSDWKGYVVNIFTGAAVAYYLGPVGPDVLHWFVGDVINAQTLKNRIELTGLILGAGGVAVVGWFYDFVDAKLKKGPPNGDSNVS